MGSPKEPSAHERQIVALGRVLQSLREGESLDDLIEITIQYLQSEFDYALVWIGLYHRGEHRLLGKGGVSPTGDTTPLKQWIALNPGDLLEQVVMQLRPVGVPDLRDDSRAGDWRKIAQKLGIQGTVMFPIRHKDYCLGVALLGSTLWGISPHSEEKARLSTVLGSLGAALYQLELEQQRQKTKRPEEPLLNLLTKLRSLPTLDQRLEAVVEETHHFIQPDRTSVYWFEPQRRQFWRRVSNLASRHELSNPSAEITAQDVNSFYQALAADQLVTIGEASSAIKADIAGRLTAQLGATSLLSAPILFHEELLGFLAVEGKDPRIWTEEEKTYARGAAHLIALTAPLEDMETAIQSVKQDQALVTDVSKAIYSDDDWTATLKRVSDRLCARLGAERLLVLLYSEDSEHFDLCYQTQPHQRRPVGAYLDSLNGVDWQMLQRSTEAIGIENLEEDLKLMAWREPLLEVGVRSLLVCSTSLGRPIEGVVVVGHETARTWNRAEREVLRVISQQIGVILHQWQLQRQAEQQDKFIQTIQWGLTTMQQIHERESLERSAMQNLTQVMQVPLATMVVWQPGRQTARLEATVVTNNRFSVATDFVVPVHSDTLVQWALQADSLLPVSIDDIPGDTRQWLNGPEIGQILVMALRTAPDHVPTGIVMIADHLDRYWPERQLNTFSILVNQLAWSRRYLSLADMLSARKQDLERLNWYKNRRLEETYRALGNGVKRLNELSHQKDALASMRYQQTVRQLGSILGTLIPVLRQEQWRLHTDFETMPLATLLKRSLERVEGVIKQRQLWAQVHNEGTSNIGGDVPKIEFVLHELLTAACYRSPTGGRLDIWCRPVDDRTLELSITDNGMVEPKLLEELHLGRPEDLLAPSALEHPPGLHLGICQALMLQLGGEFNLFRLEDGRILSRLVIPVAGMPPTSTGKTVLQ